MIEVYFMYYQPILPISIDTIYIFYRHYATILECTTKRLYILKFHLIPCDLTRRLSIAILLRTKTFYNCESDANYVVITFCFISLIHIIISIAFIPKPDIVQVQNKYISDIHDVVPVTNSLY
jgi:hypothetical protein